MRIFLTLGRAFLLFVFTSCCLSSAAFAQAKYWIDFTDKDIENYDHTKFLTEGTRMNRLREGAALWQYSDVPVRKEYIQALRANDIEPIIVSRWFNSVSAVLTDERIANLKELPFVQSIVPLGPELRPTGLGSGQHSSVLSQLGAEFFDKAGLNGKGVSIGIIDAGFADADSLPELNHVFKNRSVKVTRDFLSPGRDDFYRQVTRADRHGTKVWRLVAGYNDTSQLKYGLATNADFYLARTEDGIKEYRVEEDAWVAAIEWMDSLGVRLVTTSLGYTDSFDDPKENYKSTQMDGQTSRVAQAAEIAATEKGIFVVVAAGNEGNLEWETLSTPADAKSAFAVGACGFNTYKKKGYSSIGPDYIDYVKPDAVCFSTNGTSYSAPSMAGFVACLIQQNPGITNLQLKEAIYQSCHLYPFPNNYIGYGVPDARKAMQYVKGDKIAGNATTRVSVRSKEWLYTYESLPELRPVCFYKKDEIHVIKQEELSVESRKRKNKNYSKEKRKEMKAERKRLKKEGKYVAEKYNMIRVSRMNGAKFTTVHTGDGVYELIWE